MKAHLTGEQLLESLLQAPDASALEHLADCPACSGTLARLRRATLSLRGSAQAQAEKPEAFWTRQRSAAASRITRHPGRPLAWAAALAASVLAAMLIQEPRPVPPATPPPDPDQVLLVSVERALHRQLPQALAPAALLTQEISRNVKPAPVRQSKGESQ